MSVVTSQEQGIWNLDDVYKKTSSGFLTYDVYADPTNVVGFGSCNNLGACNTEYDTNYQCSFCNFNCGGAILTHPNVPGRKWRKVQTGGVGNGAQGFLIDECNSIYVWGGGTQCGVWGNSESIGCIRRIQQAPNLGTGWCDVSMRATSTGGHAHGVKTDGTLWSWGQNQVGQWGTGEATTQYGFKSSPAQVPGTNWNKVSQFGNSNIGAVYGLKKDGSLWAWGRIYRYDTTFNATDSISPIQVPGCWCTIAEQHYAMGAIKCDGTLWTWNNAEGFGHTLGVAGSPNRSSPTQVPGSWSEISMNFYSGSGIKTDGTLWIWGCTDCGLLGIPAYGTDPGCIGNPSQIPGTWTKIVKSGNSLSNGAFKRDGTAWFWGQCGDGIWGAMRCSPVQVPGSQFFVCGSSNTPTFLHYQYL